MKPLVSILIPAFNAEAWIADTINSAIGQTWPHKEIIVVDDGSTDQTLTIARQFASKDIAVVTQKNQGAASTRNHALSLSQGDFVQWLDADDLLSPDKVEKQMRASEEIRSTRMLFSSGWGYFAYRNDRAQFSPTSLWSDLSPVEWLLRKMSENLHMQTATWLMSRELAEAAGPWDTRLLSDDDGEYFCRVLMASEGTRFVDGTGVLYRVANSGNLSFIGSSDKKKDAMLKSMELYTKYLRSMEESERVRRACLIYLQNWYEVFYPERPDLVAKVQALATELHGPLKEPGLRWKYAWLRPIFGWKTAKAAQRTLPQIKGSCARTWDKMMYRLQTPDPLNSCIQAQ